jgi:hypothetical protein
MCRAAAEASTSSVAKTMAFITETTKKYNLRLKKPHTVYDYAPFIVALKVRLMLTRRQAARIGLTSCLVNGY